MDQLELAETTEQKIVAWLKENRYTKAWLAKKVFLSESFLNNVLKGTGRNKRKLKKEHLDRINEALGTQFKLND